MRRFEVKGPPSRWVVRGGRPAEVIRFHGGMPSYEHGRDRKLVVFDNLVAFGGHDDEIRVDPAGCAIVGRTNTTFLPVGYDAAAVRSVAGDHELCALHDDPDAMWEWRPLVYELTKDGMTRFGSQMELTWRWGLAEAIEERESLEDELRELAVAAVREKRPFDEYRADGDAAIAAWERERERRGMRWREAEKKADRLLLEHLAPAQRLDLKAYGWFYARGTINKLYRIQPGNGCAIANPRTREVGVSLCLHPERWMPDGDVALATLLLIQSGPEGEEEMLAGARPRLGPVYSPSTRLERAAWERERELLPAPLPG